MKSSRLAVMAFLMLAVLLLPSCGFRRKLISITIIPDKATLGGPGLDLQLKAVGNYIHPPDSRDITDTATWESAAPQVISVDAHGLATSGEACGTDITITATAHSDPHDSASGEVIGTAAITVTCPTPPPGL